MPDLRLPITELLAMGGSGDSPNTLIQLSPDLATPYSHQYNFSWEPELS